MAMKLKTTQIWNRFNLSIASASVVWIALMLMNASQLATGEHVQKTAAMLETGIHLIIMYLAVQICQSLSSYDKKTFIWLVVYCVALFLTDVTWWVVVYVYNIISGTLWDLTFSIPYLICLPAAIIFMANVLTRHMTRIKIFPWLLSGFVISNIIIMLIYVFSQQWHIGALSYTGLYQIVTAILELIMFDLAILCLIFCREKGIMLFLSGIIIIISGDFWIKYSFITQTVDMFVYGELFWMMGLLLQLLGLVLIKKEVRLSIEKWFSSANTIRSRLIFWTFCVSMGSLITFSLFTYLFSSIPRNIFAGLPFFVLFYSIVLVSFSFFMGKKFEALFKKLERNISLFSLNHEKNSLDKNFSIDEFVFLNNFIIEAIDAHIEKNEAKKQLVQVVAQVAHDIRSPLSALQVLIEKLPEIDEFKRIMFRDAVIHIRDITNNLERNAVPQEKQVTQIAMLVEQVLSERRTTLSNQKVKINQDLENEAYTYFVNVIPSEMRRVVTNLVNNAIEAIFSEGIIDVKIFRENGNILISIADNGTGIPKDILDNLFTRGLTTKNKGSGLGLFYAKETVSEWNGKIEVTSELGKGSVITISLPEQTPPSWFIHNLTLDKDSILICVDDCISIWHAWQERFALNEGNLELRYCKSKSELFLEMEKQESRPCVYLVDYEFTGQKYTGIALVQKILAEKKPEDIVLFVTSRCGEHVLQEFCERNTIYIIPKFFAFKIPIHIGK